MNGVSSLSDILRSCETHYVEKTAIVHIDNELNERIITYGSLMQRIEFISNQFQIFTKKSIIAIYGVWSLRFYEILLR